jgi:chorismate mutase/prephenate dehydrogenase
MSDELDPFTAVLAMRASIDALDHALVNLLAERRALVTELFEYKRRRGLPLIDQARESDLLAERMAFAEARGVPEQLAARVFEAILETSHTDASSGAR